MDNMKQLRVMMMNSGGDQNQQQFIMYQMMILKFRFDDELFLQHNIAENQLRYLLSHYNLYDDPEMGSMAQYDQMLGGGY